MTFKDQLKQCFTFPSLGYLLIIGIVAPLVAEGGAKLGLEFPENLAFALVVGLILGGLMRYHRKKRYGDI